MPRSLITRSFICLSAAAVVLGLSACANKSAYPGYQKVSSNLTPDMLTLHNRPIDAKSAFAVSTNENWRMFWADLGRASLLDRPSGLSPEPHPH